MDIRDLRQLLAIADEGTLTRAGDVLHVSRQAVAKTLKSLEREAGARLFERSGSSFVPTGRGSALISEARPIIEAFDELCRKNLRHPGGAPASALSEVRETLSISLVTRGSGALPDGFIERFSALHPQVALGVEEMSTDAVLAAVDHGNTDLGIVGSHPELMGNLEFCLVRSVGIWLYVPASHPLAGRAELSLADLDCLALITAGEHNHVHRFVMTRCAKAGVRPDIRATTTDTGLLVNLVREHGAACFGFPPDVAPLPPATASVHLDVAGGDAFGTYVIRKPHSSRSSAAPRAAAARFWEMAKLAEKGA